jgi:hypothetical protein
MGEAEIARLNAKTTAILSHKFHAACYFVAKAIPTLIATISPFVLQRIGYKNQINLELLKRSHQNT